MSSASLDTGLKSARLQKLFVAIIEGKRAVKNSSDAKLFFEAICNNESHSSCIERLVAASNGLRALQRSIRCDISSDFVNKYSADLLIYITDDSVLQLCEGQLLHDVLVAVAEPPTFWNAMLEHYNERALSSKGIQAFAFLIWALLYCPRAPEPQNFLDIVESTLKGNRGLLTHSDTGIRNVAYKIQNALLVRLTGRNVASEDGPGGRHDNDYEDFRRIDILPTKDELIAKDQPYFLQAEAVFEVEPSKRTAIHIDNQFRLLREDMLGELRNDIQAARGRKSSRRTCARLGDLVFHGIHSGYERRNRLASIALRCYKGAPKLKNFDKAARKKYFDEHKNLLKHQSLGVLLCDNEIVALGLLERDTDLLSQEIPIILIQISGDAAITKTLTTLKSSPSDTLEFVMVDTPFFAYEPILRCLQEKTSLPLIDDLMRLSETTQAQQSLISSEIPIALIEICARTNLRKILDLDKDIELEQSQAESLIAGLSQSVSLIQGPPGTGKSFIGALLAKAFMKYTKGTILVLCYTNHALDQFLEDILDMGIPKHVMLRLGSKSSPRTKSLGLQEQLGNYRGIRKDWHIFGRRAQVVENLSEELRSDADEFMTKNCSNRDILESLQFSDRDSRFFDALSTLVSEDGMVMVDEKGKNITELYLIDRWLRGNDAGVYRNTIGEEHKEIWQMPRASRQELNQQWRHDLCSEQAAILQQSINLYNTSYESFAKLKDAWKAEVFREKRIIGCTTTAAAKYNSDLQNANPSIVLVEEAGEILESHVLTALGRNTKQLVLIGDHQQLRPKINNYELTVEQGNGFDLNRSLFERLVLSDHPHTTLTTQHRMRPEISVLIRSLAYPNLKDDPKTRDRPSIRGLQSNVIFLNHEQPETDIKNLADKRDEGSIASRQNEFEVEMILKVVRYLAQQGYGTDQQVVLTPYLGQLHLLLERLKAEHDPILNDLDAYDLVRAGLLPSASSSANRRRLKISTIDNYQGEESDIIIASLTRSNKKGDIGFMTAPQRVNVLLSRARNGLIIIGNSNTFTSSKKGGKVWIPLMEQLSQAGQIYDGLPVKCERHPTRMTLLKKIDDFDNHCPDGGCSEPCQILLSCGVHKCPQRCHQLADHSKVKCKQVLKDTCSKGHSIAWECWETSRRCRKCDAEERRREEQQKRDHELELKREENERAYARRLAELDGEIAHEQRVQKEHIDAIERRHTLRQREKDLANARAATLKTSIGEQDVQLVTENGGDNGAPADKEDSQSTSTLISKDCSENIETVAKHPDVSPAKADWDYQKQFENADNEHLDTLMSMIGLEAVKQQVLEIKAKIDTRIRQNVKFQNERFGVSLLGNPGTGKTTVARIYAKFLASIGVLPGTTVVEITGAKLSNEGVQACKKLIEGILNAGGGAIFIDEAYQLASDSNIGGTQILDFLLAEVENLTGKVVFILAGYNKQMEKFFAHNPGIPSRFPYRFDFIDYEDDELVKILSYGIKKRFSGRMKLEGGILGLFCRIVARRIGYGRGVEGFGNARTVENTLENICSRQAKRLTRERRAGKKPDDMYLTSEDLIGPEPSVVLENNKAWKKLSELTGLKSVKDSIKALLDSIQYNYERELEERPLTQFNLNKVFLGSPGTGKTTVAKLYGQILADIGLLSSGEVVVKNPSDFVGDALGTSEKITKGILASTVGKVLIIDEAYGLHTANSGNSDPYKTAVIDTIVAEVQSVPGDDRCVLLLGYRDQMEVMFQNVNPGLTRRFPISEAFEFEDFTDEELRHILDLKLKQQSYGATDQAKSVAMRILNRRRNHTNFGNAGEVDILLDGAKARYQQRRSKNKLKGSTLEAIDVDPDFDRSERAASNVRMLFKDVIGCEDLIAKLEGYQKIAANMNALDLDPREQIPFNFLFQGPPGTGKTSTARKMGKIYYDMNFLETAEVLETSVTDLVGEYVGQTGPKTQQLFEKALGRVLFIDEAYRLREGQFAKEAMEELVDCLTKPKFERKLIVILAGYEQDINALMSINPGLTSRFPETITFNNLTAQESMRLLTALLGKKKHVKISVLESSTDGFRYQVLSGFEKLASLANWANARDTATLAKRIFNKLVRDFDATNVDSMNLDEATVLSTINAMIEERSKKAQLPHDVNLDLSKHIMNAVLQQGPSCPPPNTTVASNICTQQKTEQSVASQQPETEQTAGMASFDVRDDGVTDTVWERLEADKAAAVSLEKQFEDLILAKRNLESTIGEEQAMLKVLEQQTIDVDSSLTCEPNDPEMAQKVARQDEARQQLEKERLQRELERRKYEEELAALEHKRLEMERQRKKEQAAQQKLRSMGLCVAGFRWIKQSGGYRCAGGSHFVSDSQLGLE